MSGEVVDKREVIIMNFHTHNQESGKKYIPTLAKTSRKRKSDISQYNSTKEEKEIIGALRNADKIARGEIKTQPFNENNWLDELIKWADNERKKENE